MGLHAGMLQPRPACQPTTRLDLPACLPRLPRVYDSPAFSRCNAPAEPTLLCPHAPSPPADRIVLKTCGTTKLLSCVPYMCQLAASVGMEPARVKYTRASFLFPEQQPAPHTSFDQECDTLKGAFTGLGSTSAYVLGDGLNGLQWHVFVAGAGWGRVECGMGHGQGELNGGLGCARSRAGEWREAGRAWGGSVRVPCAGLRAALHLALVPTLPAGHHHHVAAAARNALPPCCCADSDTCCAVPLPAPALSRRGERAPHGRAPAVHPGGVHDGAGAPQGRPVLPL